ncbi:MULTISPECIES: hypothetical protein [unclassified Marinovum]
MKRHRFEISLAIEAPFLFPGLNAGRHGLDKVALRDRSGNLILPQDQLRGIVLEAAKAMLDAKDPRIKNLFGADSGDAISAENGNFKPAATRIFFDDLKASVTGSARPKSAYHRVRIDDVSGAAATGQLVVLEQCATPGAIVPFSGQFTVYGDDIEADFARTLVLRALDFHVTIGSHASIGFGKVSRVDGPTVTPAKVAETASQLPENDRLIWTFKLDRPYLVDADRIVDNAYLGSEDIPGGALKGCLARNLELMGHDIHAPDMVAALAQIHIGTARRKEGVLSPLSLVQDHGDATKTFDLLDRDKANINTVPKFQLDWKAPCGDALEHHTLYEERVHTAIAASKRIAEAEKLFATIAVDPENHIYHAKLDLAGLDGSVRTTILNTIASGLSGLGKTNASVNSVRYASLGHQKPAAPGKVALIVKTPALLAMHSDGEDARSAYVSFWKSILPNSTLGEFYARQTLRGGYQSRRYQPDGRYRNWILTDPGSVFEIDLHPDDCVAMGNILSLGLCRSTAFGHELNWENCPFVAENGFGEMELKEIMA